MPEAAGGRVVNVIHIEAKGKERAKIPEVMEFKKKKTRFNDEATGPSASMETEDKAATSWQWSKMVSTRTSKVMGTVGAMKEQDVLPVLDAYLKGQRICKV